jgi:Uncharacterised protein conserved in bacteria (DUF2336)
MRGALLLDSRLDLTLRQKLVDASSHALCTSNLVQSLIGSTRATELERETISDSALDLVEYAELEALPVYVRSLRDQGRLTSALAMKALVYGRIDFVATILSDLAGRKEDHIRSVLVRGGENAVRALLKDIGFKGLMLQLALKALLTWRNVALGKLSIGRQELAWQLMREAENTELSQDHNSENDDLAAFMRKIYLEITRANARSLAHDILVEAKQEEALQLIATATLEQEIAELMLAEDNRFEDELAAAFDQLHDTGNGSLFDALDGVDFDEAIEPQLPDAGFLAEFAETNPAEYRRAA